MMEKKIVIMLLYACLSTYFSLWISDEWDEWRVPFYAFFSVPFGAFFLSLFFFKPAWHEEKPELYRTISRVFFLSFFWGVLLCVNAMLPTQNVKFNIVDQTDEKQQTLVVARYKGSLGWVYRTRW